MKKTIFSLLLGATFIFSGCSIPGFSEEKPAESTAPIVEAISTKTLDAQSDQDQFYSLVKNNMAAWNKKYQEYVPNKDTLMKNKSTFDLTGFVDLTSQMGAGSVSFGLNATGQKDITNAEDPKGTATIAFNLSTKDTPISANASGEVQLRVVEKGLYASLQKFTAQIPMAPQIGQMASPFIGKWYGESFESLTSLTNNQLNIQKLIGSKGLMLTMIEMMEEMQENPMQVFTFVKALPEKNTEGMRYFEAKMNPEFSMSMITAVVDSFGISKSTRDQLREKITKNLEAQKDEIFIIGYNPADPLASTVEGPAINMQTGEKIEGKTNMYSFSSDSIIYGIYLDEETYVNFTAQNNIFALTITNTGGDKTEEITPLTGTYSSDNISFTIIDPKQDEKEIIVEGKFSKSGNAWGGTITSPKEENIKVNFSNIILDKGNFSTNIEVFGPNAEGESSSMGTVDINYTIQATDTVEVSKPASAEPFKNIEKILQNAEEEKADTIQLNQSEFPKAIEGETAL